MFIFLNDLNCLIFIYHFIFQKGKDGGGTNEILTNNDCTKHQTQTDDDDDDDDDEDEPVYIESSPCSRWQKRRETVELFLYFQLTKSI